MDWRLITKGASSKFAFGAGGDSPNNGNTDFEIDGGNTPTAWLTVNGSSASSPVLGCHGTNCNVILSPNGSGSVGIGTTTSGTLLSLNNIANFATATSTFYSTGGINLAAGCFAISGNCIGLGSISGTLAVNQGGTGTTTWQTNSIPYYNGTNFTESNLNLNFNGTTLATPLLAASQGSGTSTISSGQGFTIGGSQFVVQQGSGNVGIGTTSPWALFSVSGSANGTIPALVVATTSGAYAFQVDQNGNVWLPNGFQKFGIGITNAGGLGNNTLTVANSAGNAKSEHSRWRRRERQHERRCFSRR